MSVTTTSHGTFSIERSYAKATNEVFEWFSDPSLKRQWFVDNPGDNIVSYEADFRVGGTEQTRWEWSGADPIPAGTIMGNDTVYLDIVPNARIVLEYSMLMGDRRFSSSLLTFEFSAEGDGTRLKATEHGAYFEQSDGPDMRSNGWNSLLDALGSSIDADY